MSTTKRWQLNTRSESICCRMMDRADELKIRVIDDGEGVPLVDCGVDVPGSLTAGLDLARITMAGLSEISITTGDRQLWTGPWVTVQTDWPVMACLASQYAGWELQCPGFFAMGSGPMRAAAAREPLFERIDYRETTKVAVGVLESSAPPPLELATEIAAKCDVESRKLTMLFAPTSSLAGTIQIVARSVETALHKLVELGFDMGQIESGFGTAPLPPVSHDDLVGIGRTNDAILYGSHVTLWVHGEDDSLVDIAARLPASASEDFGQPFLEVLNQYDRDFYKIDPMLFSPAEIELVNLDSGRVFRGGQTRADLLEAWHGAE